MFLYGRNSVFSRLKYNPSSIKRIFVNEKFEDPWLSDMAGAHRIPLQRLYKKQFSKMKGSERIYGIAAEVERFVYTDFDKLLYDSVDRSRCFLFLDRIYDPVNLGSIIRTAACFGRFAVVIPKYNACGVNETVIHVAEGGENFVPVCLVSNISNSLKKAKKEGYWIVGAMAGKGDNLLTVKFSFPLCLVLGSEGEGIRYGIQKQLDFRVRIPMEGSALSFNVAVSSAILCYEVFRQRKEGL